ncbi:MAG: hypothetical protein QNJ72_30860, partial [Pleurocapsa sp. MO_226.B13]|nr:hypothetical protein [Pleurocapsa sp. MO_226.B13]
PRFPRHIQSSCWVEGLWTYQCRGHDLKVVSRYVRLNQKDLIVRLGMPTAHADGRMSMSKSSVEMRYKDVPLMGA